ncbi:MAG: pectate lyase family protein [Methermicoccaceae archaeon]
MKGLAHVSVGTELTQSEYESDEGHEISHGTSFPSSPSERDVYYRDDKHTLYVYDGTAWVALKADGLSVAASDASDLDKARADYICDGTADDVEIQAAIDALTGAGTVYLYAGTYTLASSITLKSGLTLEGVFPQRKDVEPTTPDDSTATVVDGTILKGDGTFALLTGTGLHGVVLKNLAFQNGTYGINFGDTDKLGCALSRFENLYFDNMSTTAIKLVNLQHVHMSHIKAIVPESKRFLHLVNDHSGWDGGNSVFDDLYAVGGAKTDGIILLEAPQRAMTWMNFNRPQVNLYGDDGTGTGIKITNNVRGITLLGVDVEGNMQSAVTLEGNPEACLIHIACAQTNNYAVKLLSAEGSTPKWNTILMSEHPNARIYSQGVWDNMVLGSLASVVDGIYGFVYQTHPITGQTRPAIKTGRNATYFSADYAMVEPEKSNRGNATITSGNTSTTFAHDLWTTPDIVVLGPTHAEVADAVWSADEDNITITVPSAVSADRKISWFAMIGEP